MTWDHPRVGCRVRLVRTSDPCTGLQADDEGIVTFVDSLHTFHVKWDNGSMLGLIPGEDEWQWLS